jgi:4-alpha-glucanotransferase
VSEADQPLLHRLARAFGILSAYTDIRGVRRPTSDSTRAALLDAMGVDASSDGGIRRALERLETERRSRIVGPVTAVRGAASELRVSSPPDFRGRVSWQLHLITEDGDRLLTEGSALVRRGQKRLRITLPPGLPPGYHNARLGLECGGVTREARTLFLATPLSCTPIRDVIGDDRVFGVDANLYSVRSDRNRGIGDFTDLATLCEWTADAGGEFVGINPLHALRNDATHISPYSPVTRLFRNPLYIDVTSVPEFAHSPAARVLAESAEVRKLLTALRASDRVDYEAVLRLKRPVFQALHRAFIERARSGRTPRGRAYADFAWRHGSALRDFATFSALSDHLAEPDCRRWPSEFGRPDCAAVASFRETNENAVDYHAFLQFEADRQLAEAAARARSAGMRIGIYGDLAIGSAAGGSDSWAFPDLFIDGAAVGAPPDDYAPHGQNWSLPPVDPNRLAADRFRYWILLIRNALAHSGAIRIDHVMGLLRQFWIPAGRSGREGAYVRYPSTALLAILAIESRRHGAIVIGEDLGTVPRALPSLLARWGVLSTRVFYFEREPDGEFRPPSAYSRRALVTVNTHDHAPFAGWLQGREIEIRHQVGDLDSADRDLALERREAERRSLRRRLAGARILPRDIEVPPADLCSAVHAFLSRTPAPLLGVALDDLAGETEPVNLPGVTGDRFPSWTRRMRVALEKLPTDPTVRRVLEGVATRTRGIAG